MKKYCAAMFFLAWVMWDYTAIFAHGTKNEAWNYVGDHYFNWTCKFGSYWQAMIVAKNRRAEFLHWNSVSVYTPNGSTELHEYICLPQGVAPRPSSNTTHYYRPIADVHYFF